ncbi:MAG: ATP-dependent metallopeptidase FtsH/Yme1/Tma family protein, partial [Xanthomonadales bacterium]
MGSRWLRNGFIYLLILVAVVAIVFSFLGRSDGVEDKDLSEVIAAAKAGDVDKIKVNGASLTVTMTDGTEFKSRKEEGESIYTLLSEAGVSRGRLDDINISVNSPGKFGNWFGILISFLPLLLLGAILI